MAVLDLIRTTEPELLVTVERAKEHVKAETDEEDALIEGYIRAAMDGLEGYDGSLGRCLVEQTWTLYLPAFPTSGCLALPLPPLLDVVSIKYIDAAGAEQVLDPASYGCRPGPKSDVYLRNGFAFPVTATDPRAVAIEFKAGYGPPDSVPQRYHHAVLVMVAEAYEKRSGVDTENKTVRRLLRRPPRV